MKYSLVKSEIGELREAVKEIFDKIYT